MYNKVLFLLFFSNLKSCINHVSTYIFCFWLSSNLYNSKFKPVYKLMDDIYIGIIIIDKKKKIAYQNYVGKKCCKINNFARTLNTFAQTKKDYDPSE